MLKGNISILLNQPKNMKLRIILVGSQFHKGQWTRWLSNLLKSHTCLCVDHAHQNEKGNYFNSFRKKTKRLCHSNQQLPLKNENADK